jgi:uncharacterized protein YcfL
MKSFENYFECHEPKLTLSSLFEKHIYSIAILILFLLIGSGCSSSKTVTYGQPKAIRTVVHRDHSLSSTVAHLQKKVRKNHNRIAQLSIQYENCISPAKDWTRRYRHWWERPQGHWPFQFLQ